MRIFSSLEGCICYDIMCGLDLAFTFEVEESIQTKCETI